MLKRLALLLALLTLFSACALAESDPDASLMTAADETLDGFLDVCSLDGYAELYTSSDEILDLARETLAYSYDAPARAVVLKLNSDGAEALLRILLKAGSADRETLQRLQLRLFNVLPTTLNTTFGMNWIAMTSMFSYTDVMQLDGVDSGIYYVIYEYADAAQPMTYAAFSVKDGGLAFVSAGFLKLSDEMKTALFSADGANLTEIFGDAGPMAQGVLRSFLTQTIYDLTEKP